MTLALLAVACASIPGTAELWSRPGLRFVVVGEMHGTNETPAVFRDLVCSARVSKRPILVGIELAGAIESGGPVPETNDGRTSQAMFALIEDLLL